MLPPGFSARPVRAGQYRTHSAWSLGPDRTTAWTDLTLWLLVDGHGKVRSAAATQAINPGSCLLLRGGQPYEVIPARGARLTHWFAHFDAIDPTGRVCSPAGLDLPLLRHLSEPTRAVMLWERLRDSLTEASAEASAQAGAWLAALLLEVDAQERHGGQARDPVARGLDDFARRMRDAPGDAHRVATWARRIGLSRDQVRRRFSAINGQSPRAYLTLQRLRLAEHLLTHSSASIAEIAQWAGYASQHFFSRHFHRHTGMSPSGFRDRESRRPSVG